MFIKSIESEGLAHYSYIMGRKTEAVVIDPRRDCGEYIDIASREGCRIRHVLETHRNEDYVIGSLELASRTGARIWHADSQLEYGYGEPVEDGREWDVGGLKITAIHSPGHTPGSMSYLLRDDSGEPWVVFTGDALFAGDVGRVDLLGADRIEEMAGMLYETLFEKILPLGDGVIVCPAHGSGSACGSDISGRVWTTIGLEKKLNPKLRHEDRAAFVEEVGREMERPPYFRMMERLNIEGPPLLGPFVPPAPLTPEEFDEAAGGGFILDTREITSFGAAHIEGSQSIWAGGVPSYAGWLLPYDRPLLLVGPEGDDLEEATRYLVRMGYDDIAGRLAGGIVPWHASGRDGRSIDTATVQELCGLLDGVEDIFVLDVRSEEELDSTGRIPGAVHIHNTLLSGRTGELPKDRRIYIFCGSGLRSMSAASTLEREGWSDLTVVIGGLSAWSSSSCPLDLKE